MNKAYFVCVIILFCFLIGDKAFSWDNERTHKDLSLSAAENSVLSKAQGDYLRTLGLNEGLNAWFKWKDGGKTIKQWLQEGAKLEDAGSDLDYLKGTARSFNHFHDPLKQWPSAGLKDFYSGESALVWAQDQAYQGKYITLEGDQTWQTSRLYFYNALTGKELTYRHENFAKMFKGLGHQMHLIQDMAVPAHVRNDAHPGDALLGSNYLTGDLLFETYAKNRVGMVNDLASNPIFPQVDLSKNPGGLVPITQFYDTDQYKENVVPTNSLTWGLAEYTNSNFVSDDTIFTEQSAITDKHYFPYPRYTDQVQCYEQFEEPYGVMGTMRKYFRKKCSGEQIDHFVAASPWFKYAMLWEIQRRSLFLDEHTHYDYVSKLVPRAVGYSAGLLNYFFRGDINLIYDPTSSVPGYRVTNNSPEEMSGMFEIYYDNASNERVLLIRKNLLLAAANGSPVQSEIIEFNEPFNAKEQGKYIVVFRGKMGSEYEAVAGRVTGSGLEMTPPDRYAYGVIDGSSLPQQFTEIEAKVRNAAADGRQIKAGTLWAVAKYKRRTDYKPDMSADPITSLWSVDADFSYSNSAPIAVSELSSTLRTQFTFDFSAEPIPAGITDLYLNVIFEGSIGDNPGISTAMAVKDILEPTHHVLWNLTDEVSLNGHLYTAEQILADPELLALVGVNVSLIYPRQASYAVGFSGQCPPKDFSSVSAAVSGLPAGRFIRVISLFDRQENNCLNVQWWDGASPNTWSSSFRFNAAKNQTEEGVFNPAYVIPFRSIQQHFYQGVLYCRPVFNRRQGVGACCR